MSAVQIIRTFILGLKLLFSSDKEWKKPEQKQILLYDARTGQALLNYIDLNHASLLYQWGERLNLYVLLRCILSLKLSWLEYVKQYIGAVSPAVVITSTDNSAIFYELKSICPNITAVSVQIAWRGEQTDIFHYFKTRTDKRKLHVDYMLTYNQEVGQLYQKYVGGEVIPIGSLPNNHFKPATEISRNALVFISEFRPFKPQQHFELRTKGGGQATWEDIYSLERILLPFLADYCESRGLTLIICGAKNRDHSLELDFYRGLLGGRKWQWIPRSDWYSNYHVINSAEFVAFVNSTLGYESLARSKKVACFSARGNWYQNSSSWKFGWPSDFPDDGPFWTNHADVAEFKRVMDFVTSVSDADWLNTWRQFGPKIMVFDPGNSLFISLLKKLDVPIKVDNQTIPVLKAIRT